MTTATLWGFSGSLSKFVMAAGVTPLAISQGRSVVTAGLLLIYLLAARRPALRVDRRTLAWLVLFGVLLATVQVMYFSAIQRLNVATAILLEYLAPAMVVAFAWIFQGRRATVVTVGALVAALAGCALVVEAYDLEVLSLSGAGVAFGIGAAVSFSGYILTGEHLQSRVGVAPRLFYGFAVSAVTLAFLQPPWNIPAAVVAPRNLALIAAVGVFGTLVPFGCFLAALRYLDAGRATIVSTLEPVVAGVVSFVWFGEAFSLPQLLGAALVIGAVIALQRDRPAEETVAAPEAVIFTQSEV